MKVVTFIKQHGPYYPGSAAAFDPATADALVKSGVAEHAQEEPIVDHTEPAMKKLRKTTVDLVEK